MSRVHRLLYRGDYLEFAGAGVPVHMAAMFEILTDELLEMAGNARRHLKLATRNGDELNRLLTGITIAQGGWLRCRCRSTGC
ncbi:unnamed protein product [Hydatigera taeniaeformis]|uniref:Histone H2A n=1 Tax=Hydatigena taeniaeformis TaxID=6205 RepID=A0A0R3WXS3_HYDTA|nr:unnamed protein product [Hydatigera taeniaeformis]